MKKKFMFALVLGMLALLLCGGALACSCAGQNHHKGDCPYIWNESDAHECLWDQAGCDAVACVYSGGANCAEDYCAVMGSAHSNPKAPHVGFEVQADYCTTKMCTGCGEIQDIPGAEHKYNTVPNSYYENKHYFECVNLNGNCVASYSEEHSYTKNLPSTTAVEPATCTSVGLYYVKCDECDYENRSMTVEGNSYGPHKWTQTVNGDSYTHSCDQGCGVTNETCSGGTASCTQQATCTSCGRPYGPYPSHSPVTDWGSSPDCTTGGWTTGSHCGVCGKVLNDQNYIPPEGHTPVVIPAVAPTCTTTGLTEGQKCADCPDILLPQQIVPALGHTPGPEATCTAPQLCAVCSAELNPAKGHVPATDARVEPTCTATGLTEGSHCSVCNEILLAQEAIPALGHDYDSYYKGPTCTHMAFTHYICTRCGDDYAVNGIGATGHAQNWTGDGITHTSTCATCGESFNVNCPFIAVTLNEVPVQVCPICGTIGEATLPLIEGSMENAPWGNETIRGGQIEGALYAITAVLEHEGEVLPFKEDELAIITLPLEIEEGFQLVRIDWIEGVETWTEIPFSHADGVLTFETECGGLFLLLSA